MQAFMPSVWPACRCGYERRLLELLDTLVRDMDRKIERQKERADKESLPRLLTAADKAKLEELLVLQRGAQTTSHRQASHCTRMQLSQSFMCERQKIRSS